MTCFRSRLGGLVLVACLVFLLTAAARGQADSPATIDFAQRWADLQGEFEQGMRAVAQRCDDLERPGLQSATLAWIAPRDPSRQYLFLPPSTYRDPDATPALDSGDEVSQFWSSRVRELRQEYARGLLALARELAEHKQLRQAGQCLWEGLYQDPEQLEIRRILGYQGAEAGSQRITVRPARRPETKLGWRGGEYLEATSAHFRLVTNADREAAEQMLRRLQVWRLLWRQACLPYWVTTEGGSAAIVAGRPLPSPSESRHEVVLFAGRADFLAALARVPGIDQSVGYYDAAAARCYFYLDESDSYLPATWRHELVHQLFQETGRRNRQPGERSNFWLLEGVAMYFESLQPLAWPPTHPPDFAKAAQEPVGGMYPIVWSVGGFDAQRLQYARIRVQREGYLVPFRQMVSKGRTDFQADADLPRLYGQSSGVLHFLMHWRKPSGEGDGEADFETDVAYRDAVFEMLSRVYAARDRADLLEETTGVASPQLEAEYQHWLRFESTRQARFLWMAQDKTEMAIGFSQVQDRDLQDWHAPNLNLLQLTGTPIGDAAARSLARHRRLEQLFLDQTAIGDLGAVPLISANPGLQALDLAGTKITDRSIEALAGLEQLEQLWLTQTDITDQSVPRLLQLPKLQMLDIRGTQISPAGQEQLKQRIQLVE